MYLVKRGRFLEKRKEKKKDNGGKCCKRGVKREEEKVCEREKEKEVFGFWWLCVLLF